MNCQTRSDRRVLPSLHLQQIFHFQPADKQSNSSVCLTKRWSGPMRCLGVALHGFAPFPKPTLERCTALHSIELPSSKTVQTQINRLGLNVCRLCHSLGKKPYSPHMLELLDQKPSAWHLPDQPEKKDSLDSLKWYTYIKTIACLHGWACRFLRP